MSGEAQNQAGSASNFAGSLIDILDRVSYRRVAEEEQFDPVYRLRYEAYRREAFIPLNDGGVLRDEFDELPNAYCYGVYIDSTLVSSLRIHYLTPDCRMSPSYSVFTDVLDPMLDAGATCVDPTRFTSDLEATLAYPALPFLTLRLAVMATRIIKGQLFAVGAIDPMSFAVAMFVVSLMTLIAGWLPARRAACVDPVTALRFE
jgi:hypothetical protein